MNNSDLLAVDSHFAFGKNWLDYAKKIDEHRISQAMDDLRRLNNGQRLDGKSFLDIGCGSGLHALAAIRLGAARVVCVDIDPDSVAATRGTLAKFAPDTPASVEVVSVFDIESKGFGQFDVVYSWGVLHHTGDMYRAIKCAAAMVAPQGTFLIALYKKTPFCGMWRTIKRQYSAATPDGQRRMMSTYLGIKHTYRKIRNFDRRLRNIPEFNLKRRIAEYKDERGMDYYNDAHDWLGGYPYESISPQECLIFFSKLHFEITYTNIQPTRKFRGVFGSGCDEYAFRRHGKTQRLAVDA